MEEAAELGNYLPLSFKSPKEQEYIGFLWDAFENNYTHSLQGRGGFDSFCRYDNESPPPLTEFLLTPFPFGLTKNRREYRRKN